MGIGNTLAAQYYIEAYLSKDIDLDVVMADRPDILKKVVVNRTNAKTVLTNWEIYTRLIKHDNVLVSGIGGSFPSLKSDFWPWILEDPIFTDDRCERLVKNCSTHGYIDNTHIDMVANFRAFRVLRNMMDHGRMDHKYLRYIRTLHAIRPFPPSPCYHGLIEATIRPPHARVDVIEFWGAVQPDEFNRIVLTFPWVNGEMPHAEVYIRYMSDETFNRIVLAFPWVDDKVQHEELYIKHMSDKTFDRIISELWNMEQISRYHAIRSTVAKTQK